MRLPQKFKNGRTALATRFTLLSVVVTLLISTTFLTEVRSEDRIWTNSTGQELKAELVEIGDGQVQLRSARDGQIYPYEVSDLSKADQAFIALLENKPPPLGDNPTTMELFIAPYIAMGFRVALETTLIALIANATGLYLCSQLLSKDREMVKFSSALLIALLVLVFYRFAFEFPLAYAAAERNSVVYIGIVIVGLIMFIGELLLISALLTDGWIRAFGVMIAAGLLFTLPAGLLYRHLLVSEDSQARIERAEQVTVQIFMRATGEDEAPAGKTSP